nr:MAG TPA: hypothetical protein [Caudoviricetes sp.]
MHYTVPLHNEVHPLTDLCVLLCPFIYFCKLIIRNTSISLIPK